MPDHSQANSKNYLRLILHGKSFVVFGAILVFFYFGFLFHYRAIVKGQAGNDFHGYYFVTKGLIEQGYGIYDHEPMVELAQRETQIWDVPPFIYPPFFIFFFTPFSFVSFTTARILWLVLNLLFLLGSILGLSKIFQECQGKPLSRGYILLFALLAGSFYYPIVDHNWQGQSNLLLLFLITWAVYFSFCKKTNAVLAGIFWVMAILFKIFPLIFLPCLLIRKKYDILVWTLVALVLLSVLSLSVIPVQDYLEFPKVITRSTYMNVAPSLGNHSASSAVGILLAEAGMKDKGIEKCVLLIRVGTCFLFLVALWEESRKGYWQQKQNSLGLILRLSQAFILFGFMMAKWWEHHFIFLLFSYFLLYALFSTRWKSWIPETIITSISLLIVGLPFMSHFSGFKEFSIFPRVEAWGLPQQCFISFKFYGMVLLLLVLEITLVKLKKKKSEGA